MDSRSDRVTTWTRRVFHALVTGTMKPSSIMMKTSLAVFFAFLTLVSIPCGQAQVTTSTSQLAGGYSLTSYDSDYDFDVYARSLVPSTKYFIVYTLEDGSTQEEGPISTYDMAAREIYFNFEHGLSPEGTVDADIETRQVLDPLTKFNRYGTYLEALSIAWQLESLGFETDIRWVRSIQLKTKASTSLRYSR